MLCYDIVVSNAASPALLLPSLSIPVKFSTQYRDHLIGDVIPELGNLFVLRIPVRLTRARLYCNGMGPCLQ